MKSEKSQIVFRSRISVLLPGFVLALLLPAIIPMIKHMIIPGLCIIGGTFLFAGILFAGIRYIISGDTLFVKIWFIPACSLKISNIASIKRSYYLFDVPTNTTASFKKLRLQFARRTNHSYLHVSPVREHEFIEELKKVNPYINVSLSNKKGVRSVLDWDL
jgi:hypothetical protein